MRNVKIAVVRILLVSQMYPGPDDPDLGAFVRQMELALRERGHDIDLAVLDRRGGGKRRFLELAPQVVGDGDHGGRMRDGAARE